MQRASQTVIKLCFGLMAALTSCGASSSQDPSGPWNNTRIARDQLRGEWRYTPADPPEYEIKYFNQSLDHFNFENPGTFTQRYLITTKYWGIGNAPIFVFTGAEGGDPSQFYSYSYGHPVALAKQLKGLIVFLEHRFFGKSLPFGTVDSYLPKSNRVGLLSVEQALADYASIVTHVRQTYSAESSPVVAFGGSLAGTLSTFMRIKYPAIVDIAWASSTPLLGYAGIKGINQYSWRKQVTDNFEELAPGCPDIVRRGFSGLLGATPSDVHKAFNVCGDEYPGVTADVQGIAWGVLEGDGEFVYPAATSPIKAHCHAMGAASTPLHIFNSLIRIGATRYISRASGNAAGCLNTTLFRAQGMTPDARGWQYLACTEVVHPIGSNNVTDMFPPWTWSVAGVAEECLRVFGVAPRALWLPTEMGMLDLPRFASGTSHVLFAYGLKDPWHTLGVGLHNLSATLPVVTIADGSHCADMVVAEPATDTPTMVAARTQEDAIISEWIHQLQTQRIRRA
eukprot:m.896930 g.896930  ORF g.896930 m.896930 type:complete len:509 (-) comp23669_c0_seq8:2147-3673(-)